MFNSVEPASNLQGTRTARGAVQAVLVTALAIPLLVAPAYAGPTLGRIATLDEAGQISRDPAAVATARDRGFTLASIERERRDAAPVPEPSGASSLASPDGSADCRGKQGSSCTSLPKAPVLTAAEEERIQRALEDPRRAGSGRERHAGRPHTPSWVMLRR